MASAFRPLIPDDLPEADRIFRHAFGTFIGMPYPMFFSGDAAVVTSRFQAFPDGAFGVEADGRLVGSVFASCWGSFGFFGPLTVEPVHWGKGMARALMGAVMDRFDAWGTTHAGLYTFPQSPKHLGLYGSFGFCPRFLTLVMEKSLDAVPAFGQPILRYSELSAERRREALGACRTLTDGIHSGLDLAAEIESLHALGLGDTLLLEGDSGISGFAICHSGAGSEAGSGHIYLKFAAAKREEGFGELLQACEAFAHTQGQTRVIAGVNTARTLAHARLQAAGYRTSLTGIAMHRPNDPGFCREDAFVIDDWR